RRARPSRGSCGRGSCPSSPSRRRRRARSSSRLLEEGSERVDHVVDLLGEELGEDGDRERLLGGALAHGERALGVAERREALLAVEREGVVDLRPDLLLLQVREERVAPALARDAQHELVPDRVRLADLREVERRALAAREAARREALLVARDVLAARRRVALEPRQLDAEERRLERVDPEVAAHELVEVLRLRAVRAQDAGPLGEGVVLGREEPRVPEGSEILGREEGIAAKFAERPRGAALVARRERLGRVLDD